VTDPRPSYRKTLFAATAAALGGVALLAVLVRFAPAGAWRVLWFGLGIVPASLVVIAALILAGGLIAFRRQALLDMGVSLVSRSPRERPYRGFFSRAGRWLRVRRSDGIRRLDLRPGEWIEVRSLAEILRTLDDDGRLDGTPFMPEMVACCGRRFLVFRRVDKINDWIEHTGLHQLRDTVLLDRVRCDGAAHGGCQASCHIRWKEAWLRRSAAGTAEPGGLQENHAPDAMLHRHARFLNTDGEIRYDCQLTGLTRGTSRLHGADPRHYLRDLVTGNVRFASLLSGLALAAFNAAQHWRGGVPFPAWSLPDRADSPHAVLGLKPGETVRVRTKREIEATLNRRRRNRGLWFDADMLRFCGGEFTVARRVERLIDERSGRMIQLSCPGIVLEDVTASGEYAGFCAQNEIILWREIWLARVRTLRPAEPENSFLTTHAHSR
jgi:hypothetical protein